MRVKIIIEIKLKYKKGKESFLKRGCFLMAILFSVFCFSLDLQAEMSSDSYMIKSDVIGAFGNNSDSASYQLGDTGGETATEDMTSASYYLRSGFWPAAMEYHISLSCDTTVNMGEIAGTGQSDLTSNEATCVLRTDNPIGYSLTFISDTASMLNVDNDIISAYTPASGGTPEQWSVASSASEWGARLKKNGTTTYDSAKWGVAAGTENYAASDVKWHNVTDSSSFIIVSNNTETAIAGDTEILQFGAEVGTDKIQPTGTYDVDVTVTAVAN